MSPPKKDYSKEAADYLKYIEEQEKGQKRFSSDYDRMDGLVDLET